MADVTFPTNPVAYEVDEHQGIECQIAALSDGDLNRIDREHLVEYLVAMTLRDRRELASRLKVLIQHILRCQHQPERLTPNWRLTIAEQQDEIRDLVDGIPSLGADADELLRQAYPRAAKAAAIESGLSISTFPVDLPMTVTEALAFEPPDNRQMI